MDVSAALTFVEEMEQAVMTNDKARVARYLTETVAYTVGARPTLNGIDAVLAAVAEQGTIARWDGHTFVKGWIRDDALVVEVVSHFTRQSDERRISFPCADIYRFQGGRIADWRVYADMSPFHAP